MVLEEMSSLYSPWCCLQQPIHPAAGVNVSFRMLLAAVDQGWMVVEPVRVILAEREKEKTFHFTLVQGTTGQLFQILVAATPEVEQFIGSGSYVI